ncbi:hypothetical protein MTR67_035214, partial [Solanum verrucosum]
RKRDQLIDLTCDSAMQRQIPPKHRHDGTSPLPLGMDWSPPPKNWAGRETVWPHDPHTGWSYCVTIPSWVVLAKTTNSDPIVVQPSINAVKCSFHYTKELM